MSGSVLHEVETGALRALISTPSGPAPGPGGWPVLCFLHGYDEAAPLDIHRGLRRHGPLREGSSPRAVENFVVVAPQLPTAGDVWCLYTDDVERMVREVHTLRGGDPGRTYLTGFSFGGNGVFDLAQAHPDLWAVLWPVDPTRVPADDPGLPVWLSFGEVARRRKHAFVERLRLRDADDPPEGDRQFVDRGEDHVGSATTAYREDRVYDWLLSRKRRDPGA